MATNQEVIKSFFSGYPEKSKNVFSEQTNTGVLILYSYGYHFPLAIRLKGHILLINKNSYSATTSQHQGILARELGFNNFKELLKDTPDYIKLFDTEKLKSFINQDITYFSDIAEQEI